MSEPIDPATPESRAAEAAAIRRRWISLGEGVAVLAVAISALTLYLNWSDKRDERTEKAAETARSSARSGRLVLGAASVKDDRIALAAADPAQIIQSQTILFPKALGVAPVDTTGAPRIEADWFAPALKRAREKAGLPDDSVGDEQMPVAITTRFTVGGDTYSNVALYDVGYGIRGGWIAGHHLTLRGLSHVDVLAPGRAQSAIDARWARLASRRP